MTQKTDHDYVLGTHDAEIARLAFQHAIWTDEVQHAWRTAGIGAGARVMDVGAGPGFASVDLARIVGPTGRVFAVERSQRFLDVLANAATAAGHHWIEPVRADLMEGPLPVTDLDAAWCRWVACFVPDVAKLIAAIAAALKPGGRLVLHEYHAYSTYGLLPNRPEIRSFVDAVYESWRAQGGEPDIATRLPKLLVGHGFEIVSARPLGFAARLQDRRWNWPAGFVRTNVPRLVELGVRDQSWANQVLRALEEAEQDPASIFITPTVLELIAVRRDAVSKP